MNNLQLIWIVAFVTTVALDVMVGLIISVLFALMTLIFRSQWLASHLSVLLLTYTKSKAIMEYSRPRWERLVQLSAMEPYFDNPKRYIAAANMPNIRLYRFQSPLLFNNVERFKLSIYGAVTDWGNKPDSIVRILFEH